MSEIKKILNLVDQINEDCEEILELRRKADIKLRKEKTNIEIETEDLIKEMQQSLENFRKKNFDPIKNEFDKVIALLASDYKAEADSTKADRREFAGLSLEESNVALNKIVDELNGYIETLNGVDFEALVPHVKIEIEGETFYTYTEEQGKLK